MPDSVESSPGIGLQVLRIESVERMAMRVRSTKGGKRVKFGIPNGGGGCCVANIMVKGPSISLVMSLI